LGDEHGHLIHLLARDCSIQRRNQKILEESPAVKLTDEQLQRLFDYAVRFAKHAGYTNAGTIEFLVSPEGGMYFLEMNTRLQVEHGVTEMITGLDLVELQLRVAAGEKLTIKQDDVKAHGHAIEARIYPEDPVTFMPSAGVIESYHEPTGKHVRVDSALRPRYEVTTHYESIIAKLICWGETREEARKRLLEALTMFRLEGVKCNIPLLRQIVSHPIFINSTYHTDFLATVGPTLRQDHEAAESSPSSRSDKELAAAIGTALLMSMTNGPMLDDKFEGRRAGTWKLVGRKEQMLIRGLGARAWR
jgi:acetyl-CoA carboxylase biotin carboxylase subunit